MKIVFLLSHVPDPRMNKRISVAKRVGTVAVIYVNRTSQDIFELEHGDIEYSKIDLDIPPSDQIIKRLLMSQKYKRIALKILFKYNPDIIYTEGLDSLDIAVVYKRRFDCQIFYEVADLRECYIEKPKSLFKKIAAYLIKYKDKKLFKYVAHLVITSEKFYDVYYLNLIEKDKTIFMPNTPDFSVFKNYKKKSEGEFTVGFIGGIRYLKQMKMLVDAAKLAKCRVLFAGAGGTFKDFDEISEYCRVNSHVLFTGKYNYSRDIASLYGAVDCVYAVYDADNANVRIALPNKLYESIYCGLPIIVSKGTYLSQLVTDWGVGLSVSHNDVEELAEALKRLMSDSSLRTSISKNCKNSLQYISSEPYNKSLERIFLKYS